MTTEQQIGYELLLEVVEREFTANRNEFLKPGPGCRRDFNKYPRFVFIWLLRRFLGFKVVELGKLLGWNYSSVIHATKLVNETLYNDPEYGERVQACEKQAKDLFYK